MAAALAERAGRLNQPADLIAALEILEQALTKAPETPWLLFNRALLLEKLQLLTLARHAWDRYIDAEPGSPWAVEARAHVTRIDEHVGTHAEPVNEHLMMAAEEVNAGALADLAGRYPREAREFAVEVALVRWGQATLAGQHADAERWLSAGQILGEELARLGGDRTALEAAEKIAVAGSRSPDRRELALAHDLYGRGHRLYQQRDYPKATPLLSQALTLLTSAASPVAGWARLDLGAIELHNNQNKKAVTRLSALLGRCEIKRRPSLCGRTAWALGLGLFRLGRLPEALGAHRTAAAAFLLSRESDSHAAALGLIAEALRELGDTPAAWDHRYRGLRVLGGQTRHRSSHNLLWEAGDAALEEGYPLVADLFANEDVVLFSEGQDRLLALESHFRRAVFRRGRFPAHVVLADLEKAKAISSELPVSPLLPRIEADVQLTLAEMAAMRRPETAEAVIRESLTFFRSHGLVLREAATLLTRARIRKANNSILQAHDDLESAVKLFENQREQLGQGGDRRLYSDTWQGIYDELIELAAEEPDGEQRALRLLESSRDGVDPILSAETTSNVILTYAVTPRALYRFQIENNDLQLERLAISREDLAVQVRRFADALRVGARADFAAAELTRLLMPKGLAAGGRLCFVPDRELSGVPFSALPLPDGSGPLLIRYEVMLANSVHDCSVAEPRLAPSAFREVLLVGPPQLDRKEFALADLQGAADEIDFLRRLYPNSTLLVARQATPSALIEALPKATLLHFAGHAVAHPTDPSRSFLPLASDPSRSGTSLLSAADLAKLRLPDLELAVLSACDTFVPRTHRAESISGLVRSFLDAGARAAVGTLWNVDDGSSRELLIEFHQRFSETGNAASALRAAQLHLLHHTDPELRNPSTWAAFELIVSAKKK
ncbi:MAG TPA: CHAT domain-containing protein [Thermoanaerobaculia bacterium]|nr:CHAT domain-containing protein [Thermoanaerobaculia bacterium]